LGGDCLHVPKPRLLDFGCGQGITALGIAVREPHFSVIGVDINDEYRDCLPQARTQLGLSALPSNLEFQRIARRVIDAGLTEPFDCIYSWSVFEHVNQRELPETAQALRQVLKVDGVLLVQVAPVLFCARRAPSGRAADSVGSRLVAAGQPGMGHSECRAPR
jgi:cyclopropane fatty-acyl-phospholipid synthase-like methyltransferase